MGGALSPRLAAIEQFELEPGEQPFDLVFAIRVDAQLNRRPRQTLGWRTPAETMQELLLR